MGKTSIEWAGHSWNPLRGCTKISPGCKHCYAETFAERWRGKAGHPYEQGFDLRIVPHKLADPFTWREPSTVFVNSMSDLFQEGIPYTYVRRVWSVMAEADWHVFQVLTKRAERMQNLVSTMTYGAIVVEDVAPMPHVWCGVSVENRKHGIPRIDYLRRTPAAVRFLSVEPLLEDLGEFDLAGIDWVIVGGESGPGARPMNEAWVHSIQTQCEKQGVLFFFKQWGGVRKKETGRLLHGRTWDAMPPMVRAPYPGHPAVKARRAALRLTTAQLVELRASA